VKPPYLFDSGLPGSPDPYSACLQDELGEGSTAGDLVIDDTLPSPLWSGKGAWGLTSTLADSERQPALSVTGAYVGKHTQGS